MNNTKTNDINRIVTKTEYRNKIHKIVLAKTLSKLLDTSQLNYLVQTKRDTNLKSIKRLDSKINDVTKQLNNLKSSRLKLNTENQQSSNILQQDPQLKNISQALQKKATENKTRTTSQTKFKPTLKRKYKFKSKLKNKLILEAEVKLRLKPTSIAKRRKIKKVARNKLRLIEINESQLVGSLKLLRRARDVWDKRHLTKIKNNSHANQILNTAHKLITYVKHIRKNKNTQLNECVGLPNKKLNEIFNKLKQHNFTGHDAICIAIAYQKSLLGALHSFYHHDNRTTIKSIETHYCLPHGTLLKLRRNPLAKQLEAKAFSNSSKR